MPSAADARLAWAVRAWEAEVENASRLANRANLVLTIALAFSGFGLKELSDALRTHPSSWIGRASLATAVVGVTLIGGGAYTFTWEAPGGSATKCPCCGSPEPAGN
jgi:heme/copper-type cytochrome/quinol oxidase subunit 3